MATTDEVHQGMLHRLQFHQFPFQEVQMLLGYRLHLPTWASPLLP